jgi:type IV secretory pathway VirB10-like protein
MSRIVDTAQRTTLMPAHRQIARSRSTVETVSRIVGAVIVTGTIAGAGALLLTGPTQVRAERAQGAKEPAAAVVKVASAEAKPHQAPVAQPQPKRAWAEPPLPAPASAPQVVAALTLPAAEAAPQPPSVQPAPAAPAPVASAPTDCLPSDLRAVLSDLEARFGTVTLVSTRELHTENHTRGSVRHKLHADCKAVDFKIKADPKAVTAYLRSRPEVAGINQYGNNGVFHIDHNGQRKVAQR